MDHTEATDQAVAADGEAGLQMHPAGEEAVLPEKASGNVDALLGLQVHLVGQPSGLRLGTAENVKKGIENKLELQEIPARRHQQWDSNLNTHLSSQMGSYLTTSQL